MQNGRSIKSIFEKVNGVFSLAYLINYCIKRFLRLVEVLDRLQHYLSCISLVKTGGKRLVENPLSLNELLTSDKVALTPLLISNAFWICCIQCQRLSKT